MTDLHCYASGNGSLSFCHVQERYCRNEGGLQSIATGDPVSRQDVEYFVGLKRNERFQNYLIVEIGKPITVETIEVVEVNDDGKPRRGRPRKNPKTKEVKKKVTHPPKYCLCAPVFRVGEYQLQLDDSVYTYGIDENNIFWERDKQFTHHNTMITFHHYVEQDGTAIIDEQTELKNLSIKSALLFYLNNERNIVRQYPEQDKTMSVAVDQLQEAIQKLQKAGMTQDDIFNLTDFREVE